MAEIEENAVAIPAGEKAQEVDDNNIPYVFATINLPTDAGENGHEGVIQVFARAVNSATYHLPDFIHESKEDGIKYDHGAMPITGHELDGYNPLFDR